MKNKRIAGVVLALCAWMLVGCGPSHQRVPVLEVGKVLHLSVKLPKDQTAGASGTIYFTDSTGSGAYASTPLTPQGRHLVTTLPTQDLPPGERVLYYFDVYAGGEAKSLGSAQRPYITEIVDRTELVLRSVASKVTFGKAGQPIVFELDPSGFAVGKAAVVYTMPNLPGVVTQPMAPISNGKWTAEIPGVRCTAGLWSWRIEAEIEGVNYTHPIADGGFVNFTVKK